MKPLIKRLSSSNTPVAVLSSVIWPSFREVVRMLEKVKVVSLASGQSIPVPGESNPTRVFRKGSIIADGRSVPGPIP